MLKEFKEFAMRGNVLDLAIGVIIGAAFGTVVTSLVNDILMPPIGKLMGGVDFKDYYFALDGKVYQTLDAARKATPVIAYGSFVNTIVNFLIVAFAIFLLVKQVNRFKKPAPAPAPAAPSTKECRFCSMSIPLKASRCPQCTSDLTAA
jgi:large conductance mechanosensitive channel